MKTFINLVKRNVKMFFRDKGFFFASLITPIILLVLYATFLAKVYKDSFISMLPEGIKISNDLLNGLVGGQLFSSLLAVCTVTVAFCSNMLMIQDKISGARVDMLISPVKKSKVALSYFTACTFSTLFICLIATICALIYLGIVGFYLSVLDILLLMVDTLIMTLFGVALSSIINVFLSSQGQISAVSTIVSSCYGFICGAYMPLSSFNSGLYKILTFFPFTYGTSLFRRHSLNGVFDEMVKTGVPLETIEGFKSSMDYGINFFSHSVSEGCMYLIVGLTVAILISLYVFLQVKKNKNTSNR